MNRRNFLASAATTAAILSIGAKSSPAAAPSLPSTPSTTPPSGPAVRKLKKSVKYGMIGAGATVMEKFQILRDIGFDGVELDSPNDLALDEVLKAKEATGIEVPGVVDSVHWAKPLSDANPDVRAEGRVALERAIRDCKAYGGSSVLLVPAVVNKQTSYADAYTRSQDEIRKVLPLARETGIKIAIENVWNGFLLSPLEAARYTDELDPAWVGWHFDIGNIVNFGWPEHWIPVLGNRIWKLDVKEFSRKKRDDEGLWKGFASEIGDGDCDWPTVMKAIDAIGYGNGWAAAEVRGGDQARLKDVYERMCRVLDH